MSCLKTLLWQELLIVSKHYDLNITELLFWTDRGKILCFYICLGCISSRFSQGSWEYVDLVFRDLFAF